jgi:hypothetical protein
MKKRLRNMKMTKVIVHVIVFVDDAECNNFEKVGILECHKF